MNKAKYRYDCANCTFAWNCGPLCDCILRSGAPTPPERVEEVRAFRLLAGYKAE